MQVEFKDVKGKMAVDQITGFKGTITGHCEYLTGCDQLLLTPEVTKDNTFMEGHWFDSSRITVDRPEKQTIGELLDEEKPGAMDPAPIK